MWMKVILQRDVPKVGKGGELVTVADGSGLSRSNVVAPAASSFLQANSGEVRRRRVSMIHPARLNTARS